ncbi:MAG: ATP-binding protein [Bryobacteraceae bacterium]
MSEPSIALEILSALDYTALEWRDDGLFVLMGEPPEWFHRVFADVDMNQASPYLENFLIDAQAEAPKAYSGVWTQRDSTGAECGLEAWAIRTGGKRVLLIHLLGEEFEVRRSALQQARQTKLSYERLGETARDLADAKLQVDMRNREVERLNQLKSEFLASMSHELRTPLNAIIGFSSLLAEQSAGPLNGDQQSYVAHVKKASHHLLDLINDILDLSKIEAGRLVLAFEEFALEEALSEVLSTIKPLARDKDIRLTTAGCAGHVVFADRVRFKQILYNLLSNAIKFTPRGGEVRLDASVKGDHLSIAVTDTGIGIPASEHQAIFEKFHQVGSGTRGVREGTGLGLAITKRLVEQHGGEIAVFSEPGLGSRFVFSLPYVSGGSEARNEGADPIAARTAGTKEEQELCIAVVEDNPANRALFEAMLKGHFRVTAYENGQEALDGFRQEKPDLVLLDIALPGIDGVEVLRRIRSSPSLAAVPVVAVSAYAMSGDREKFMAAGFDHYLAKPVTDRSMLLEAIEPLLKASTPARYHLREAR